MSNSAGQDKRSGFRRRFCVIGAVWTAAVGGLFAWVAGDAWRERLEDARIQARTNCDTDIMYRRWNSSHGGVYVPVTGQIKPNNLLDVPERDVVTPSGRVLTLVNPAWMTRQVHETMRRERDIRGRITSLKPIQPANASDAWEAEALRAFEAGQDEYNSVERIEGKQYMRLMRPLRTSRECLVCHADQGYVTGDIRGGISIAVPMAPFDRSARAHARVLATGHGVLWLGGMVVIAIGVRDIKKRIGRHDQAHQALREAPDDVEARVTERTAELTAMNEDLRRQLARRDRGGDKADKHNPVKASS